MKPSTFNYERFLELQAENKELQAQIAERDKELKRLQKEVASLAIESIEREKTLAKLEAEVMVWAKAEQEGRLVVLPFPIGTKVYIVVRHGVLHDKILENVVCGYSESEWQGSLNKGKDSRFVICHNSYNMPSAYELRDVFATRAEAEEALKEAQP